MQFVHDFDSLTSLLFSNVICISGCSRVGKSTLAEKIKSYLENQGKSVQKLSLDHWILDYRERSEGMTVLDRFQVDKLIKSINQIEESEILLPGYDSTSRTVIKDLERRFIFTSDYLIIEGVICLVIVDRFKFNTTNIYIDIDDEIRKERIFDFYSKHKGFDERSIRQIIEERELEEVALIKKSKLKADIIYLPKIEHGKLF